jgi:predicted RNA binding protein YcfA (HicA-like mRNA interferase family)
MSESEKILLKILRGGSDQNISFDGLCNLLENLDFEMRIKGSHHIFTRDGVLEIVNLQPKKGKAKPYQVKQVRNLIVFYRLAEDTDE